MSSIPEKYRELLFVAADELNRLLWQEKEEDVKLVQKGLLLYRQRLVSKVRFEDDLVTATVQDVTRAQVELNLNFLQISTCSCPTEGFCRHQLAVFFHVYGEIASVSEWIQHWREPLQERKNAQTWGIQRAKDLLKIGGALTADYDGWISNIRESFHSIISAQKNLKPYLVTELFQVFNRKLKAGAPVEQEWRQLYFLVASVHTYKLLLQMSSERGFHEGEISRYFRELFYKLMDDVEDIVAKLNVQALPFAFDPFIEGLKNDTTSLVTEEAVLEFEPTHLYILLWTKLFRKTDWHKDELQRLQHSAGSIPVRIASIHQHFMLREDAEASRMLDLLKEEATPYMIFWLEKLTSGKEWKRMGTYVDAFLAMSKKYLSTLEDHYAKMDFSRVAIRTIGAYAQETGKLELYEKILVLTLPYSYRIYDEFLFDSGQYEKWSDLQALVGFHLDSISSLKIKTLQKEQPEILLPLYHQSIQQHIDMKNRGSYREAVKQLKKLRTLYKKLKRQEDFTEFMELLLQRTKRLRAFQHECEYGKLIQP